MNAILSPFYFNKPLSPPLIYWVIIASISAEYKCFNYDGFVKQIVNKNRSPFWLIVEVPEREF